MTPRSNRVFLWLSYQRYALLLLALAALTAGASYRLLPWYLWPLGALATVRIASYAWFISGRLPTKMRALALAEIRIAQGRFRPASVQNYCSDPCFRVVARDILIRAGLPRWSRRQLLRELTVKQRNADHISVFVDHRNGGRVTTSAASLGG